MEKKQEIVEGYTNFLWLMLIALTEYVRIDPEKASIFWGIFFALGIMLLVAFASWKMNYDKGVKNLVPVSLVMLALNYDFGVWASGGLETSFYSFLLVCAFVCYFFVIMDRKKKLLSAGFIMCLALLTRPDAAIFFIIANAFLLGRNLILKESLRTVVTEQLLFVAPVLLIYIPYFIWRYNYYGLLFPNTYYSKAGYDSYFSRGFYYLWLYTECHFTTFLFLLSFFVLGRTIRQKGGSLKTRIADSLNYFATNNRASAFLLSVVCVTIYLVFFVAKVGGDFMYARFVMPCLPFICIVIEYSLFALPALRFNKWHIPITVLLVFALIMETSIRMDFFIVQTNGVISTVEKSGIADERFVYVNEYKIALDKTYGLAMNGYFKDLDASMLVRGGQACLAYFMGFKTCIENHGLTDTLISHLPVKQRGGKIAHEKSAPFDYLLKRNVDFLFKRDPFKNIPYRIAHFNVAGQNSRVEFITYNSHLAKTLKQRLGEDFQYTDFETYLDNYIKDSLSVKSKETLKKDYDEFKEYYFNRNPDKERESKFLSKI